MFTEQNGSEWDATLALKKVYVWYLHGPNLNRLCILLLALTLQIHKQHQCDIHQQTTAPKHR